MKGLRIYDDDRLGRSVKNKKELIPESYNDKISALLSGLPEELPVSEETETIVVKRASRFDIRPIVSAAAAFAVVAAGLLTFPKLSQTADNKNDNNGKITSVTTTVTTTPAVTTGTGDVTTEESTDSVTSVTSVTTVSDSVSELSASMINEKADLSGIPAEEGIPAVTETVLGSAPSVTQKPAETAAKVTSAVPAVTAKTEAKTEKRPETNPPASSSSEPAVTDALPDPPVTAPIPAETLPVPEVTEPEIPAGNHEHPEHSGRGENPVTPPSNAHSNRSDHENSWSYSWDYDDYEDYESEHPGIKNSGPLHREENEIPLPGHEVKSFCEEYF